MVSRDSLDEIPIGDLLEAARVLVPERLPGERLSETARRVLAASKQPRQPMAPRQKEVAATVAPTSYRLNLHQLVEVTPWLTMGTLRRFLLHRHSNGLAHCVVELDGLLLIDPVAFNRWIDERPGGKPRRFGQDRFMRRLQ